jgi:hypothetical protein
MQCDPRLEKGGVVILAERKSRDRPFKSEINLKETANV